ncbi:MAG: hypothetical protein Q8Q33_00420 [Chlamydiota bacterium]|nr:hypothetical protein [Chlamydiota bacterium]
MHTIIDKRLLKRIKRDFPIELFYEEDGERMFVLAVTHDINSMGAYVRMLSDCDIKPGLQIDVIISVPKDPDKIFPHYEIRAKAEVIRVDDLEQKRSKGKKSRISASIGIAIKFLEDLHLMPGLEV